MIITAANRAQKAVDYIMSLAKPDVEVVEEVES